MDYLISYLPDNECNPLLSPQRWANAMTYAVGIGITHKGISLGVKAWKLSFSKIRLIIKSAKLPNKNTTTVGHALSKHSGRYPETWGKMHGPIQLWDAQGMTHLRDIIRAPGYFKRIKTQKGVFIYREKTTRWAWGQVEYGWHFQGFYRLRNEV
ncbi:hypothetical protein L2C91_02675 [Rosenbergiella epipactidis]|uniref:hypothetical protein n=1 Tax=Rosenbergiella epipactidis TaxID=1544694 RepID=UPI0020266893|nr:hypothetical protein [Rosenbergiella epipactidis]MCL9667287.1 hypothetical protein [Rosenbergiella epipactidis]